LLEEGRFPDRIAWLRHHYKEKHPGMWGKMQPAVVSTEERIRQIRAEIQRVEGWQRDLLKQEKPRLASALTPRENVVRFAHMDIDKTSLSPTTLATLRSWQDDIDSLNYAIVMYRTGQIKFLPQMTEKPSHLKEKSPAVIPTNKEPWQMTLEEYAYAEASKYGHGKPRMDWIKAGYGETYRSHKTAVQRALKEGKAVPAEVLKDYPDLVTAVIPTQPSHERARILWTRESSQDRIEILRNLSLDEQYFASPWNKLPVEYRDRLATYYEAQQKEPAVIPTEPRPPSPKQELEFVSDSPEYLAFTIEDIGYREKLDTAFETAIARAKGG
jgi:hypothetical protein